MTDEITSIRRAGRRLTLLGMAVVFTLLGGVTAWATLTSIEGAVIGAGTLTVDGNIKLVQHKTGGTVAEIRVAEGSFVQAGDILLRLDDTTARSDLGALDVRLATLAVRLARLRAELAGATAFSPLADLTAHLGDAELRAAVSSEQALFAARQVENEGNRQQIREQIAQLQKQVAGLQAEKAATQVQRDLFNPELDSLQSLFDRGLTTQARLMALKRAAANADGDIAKLDAQIAGLARNIAEDEQRLLQVDRDFRAKVAGDIRDAEAQQGELTERRRDAAEQLAATEIRAPVTGYVHQLTVHTIGGVVAPGATMLSVVPANASLAADLMIEPTEIDQVSLGARTHLRILAGNQRLATVLPGAVTLVDHDATVNEHSGKSYYRIRVELPVEAQQQIADLRLVPGMPVQGFIVTGERSPAAFLLAPLTEQITHAWRER
jgi:HlyD family secretion protein